MANEIGSNSVAVTDEHFPEFLAKSNLLERFRSVESRIVNLKNLRSTLVGI